MMGPRTLIAASAAAFSLALGGSVVNTEAPVTAPTLQKPTTNDGVYSKKQADAAKAQYDKICADCHPFTVAGKKKPKDVPLGGDPFYENWTGRPLAEMITTIALTMPNDGSAVVTDEEAANLVAYILQQNGFAPGSKPLTKTNASAVVARPKK